jgi:hypothetical protein
VRSGNFESEVFIRFTEILNIPILPSHGNHIKDLSDPQYEKYMIQFRKLGWQELAPPFAYIHFIDNQATETSKISSTDGHPSFNPLPKYAKLDQELNFLNQCFCSQENFLIE